MSTENRECVSREDKAVRQLKLEVRDRAVMPVLLPRREDRPCVAFCISVVKREEDEVLVRQAGGSVGYELMCALSARVPVEVAA